MNGSTEDYFKKTHNSAKTGKNISLHYVIALTSVYRNFVRLVYTEVHSKRN
ncbi:MAG: hypothetical protein ABI760_05015 [Ferruginibacter sp.]